jgi:hypothetical protein
MWLEVFGCRRRLLPANILKASQDAEADAGFYIRGTFLLSLKTDYLFELLQFQTPQFHHFSQFYPTFHQN